MTPHNVTAPRTPPERLDLLLPWLNGDSLSRAAVIERLWEFLEVATPSGPRRSPPSQTGYARASLEPAVRELYGYEGPDGVVAAVSVDELERLRLDVRTVLAGEMVPLHLRFTVRPSNLARHDRLLKSSISKVGKPARREILGPGHYVVFAEGNGLRDTVLYVFMWLLTAPGAARLSRCAAPAAGDWDGECGRWIVAVGQRPGRQARYCSDTCRVRSFRKARSQRLKSTTTGRGERRRRK